MVDITALILQQNTVWGQGAEADCWGILKATSVAMEAGGLGDFGVSESRYLVAITLASAPSCTNLIVIFLCLLVEDWCTVDAQRTEGGREEESVKVTVCVRADV